MRISSTVLSALSATLIVACYDSPTAVTAPDPSDLAPLAARAPSAQKIRSVTVSPSSASIEAGNTAQLSATTKPASTLTFIWTTSSQSIATVTQSGLVTGVAPGTATISASAGGKTGSSAVTVTAVPPDPAPGATLIAAGDIADCNNNNDQATATLIDGIPGTVAVLGDNAYENGSATDYSSCYQPTWGRHFDRTMPSVGNHEYQTAGATGYYGYFGAKAGDPTKGYYSYNLGDWHVIVLNSNILQIDATAQLAWLRADLIANSGKVCTLAYWHHPRFSSGTHGNDLSQAAFWDSLYTYNADVVLNGHDHNYERFAPQTPSAAADNARGIREFVVGTGGRALRTLGTTKANSQVFNSATYGVLKLTLSASSYSWQFVPIAGQTFTDSGSANCH